MPSFGEKLKLEREKRKITLDQISASTKIGTRMLQALEEDRFTQLPGGIFNKGFVRAYARVVDSTRIRPSPTTCKLRVRLQLQGPIWQDAIAPPAMPHHGTSLPARKAIASADWKQSLTSLRDPCHGEYLPSFCW